MNLKKSSSTVDGDIIKVRIKDTIDKYDVVGEAE